MFMWVVVGLTVVLSSYNWMDEGHGKGFVLACFGVAFSSVLAVLIYSILINKFKRGVLGAGALISVLFGLSVSAFYAFNGASENSTHSASQLHIVVFPAVHFIFTVIVMLISLIISIVRNRKISH